MLNVLLTRVYKYIHKYLVLTLPRTARVITMTVLLKSMDNYSDPTLNQMCVNPYAAGG